MRKQLTRTSKFLSLVLRHDPGRIGLELDHAGWASVEQLLRLANESGHPLSPDALHEIVETNEKRRFAFSEDGLRIRASQGHSIGVDLGLEPVEPPEQLYHGTATRNLNSIRRAGLVSGNRQHVHLSADPEAAQRVGSRHGKPVVLVVESGRMQRCGSTFLLSANGVWLTDHVPPHEITFPEE